MQTERLESIVIIPARAGSKGVPGKNLRAIGGKSLVARAAQRASMAERVSAVYVSTDSQEIAEEAFSVGANVLMRSEELSGDDVTSEEVLLDAMNTIMTTTGLPDVVALVQCTAPFMIPGDIDCCIAAIDGGLCEHSFCVSQFSHYVWTDDQMPTKGFRLPRQMVDSKWLESGSVYAFRAVDFMRDRTRFCGTGIVTPIDPARAFEIDTEADLAICRALQEKGDQWA